MTEKEKKFSVGKVFSPEFLDKTRKLFRPLVGEKELTDAECIEISNTMIQLELLLRQVRAKHEKTQYSFN